MQNRRMIVLGIDGMDFDYVKKKLSRLPNLKKLAEKNIVRPFKSVFPPDSIPAWITAYTGKDPSEHGILESVNYLAKGKPEIGVDRSVFFGKTFWDYLGKNGYKVCVINPFMAYPVWDVNGVMINGPVFISGNIQVSNWTLVEGIKIPKSLGGITEFPNKNTLNNFCKKVFRDTEEQMKFGVELLVKTKPHFFFQAFLTLDRLQHFLWRYCDANDPTYPGKTQFEGMIDKLYVLFDKLIGYFTENMKPSDQLVIVSDHGHSMRCTKYFNINEYLRRKGFVLSPVKGKLCKGLIIEKLKNNILFLMDKFNLEDYIHTVAKLVPNAKKMKTGNHIIDKNKNIAYASEFAGSNSFGGIEINKNLTDNYQVFRENLIAELKKIKYKNGFVFEWVKPREQIYKGKYLNRFPDILFLMKPELGTGWNMHSSIISINPIHKKISGGHRENGIIALNYLGKKTIKDEYLSIHNLFPTILNFYEINYSTLCSGKSFL